MDLALQPSRHDMFNRRRPTARELDDSWHCCAARYYVQDQKVGKNICRHAAFANGEMVSEEESKQVQLAMAFQCIKRHACMAVLRTEHDCARHLQLCLSLLACGVLAALRFRMAKLYTVRHDDSALVEGM
jgi:hypothetical protein